MNNATTHAVLTAGWHEKPVTGRLRWILPTLVAAVSSAWLISLNRSFWYDEAFSVGIARASVGGILDYGRTTEAVTEIGYYLTLHGWSDGLGFGYSEQAVRGLSALCAVGSVPVVYAIARRLHGDLVATVAATFMSASPFLAEYSAEGRQYGLVLLASSLVVYAYLRFKGGSAGWMLAYVAAGVLAVGAHWFAALVLIAILGEAVISARRGELPLARVLALAAGSIATATPAAILLLDGRRNDPALAAVGWIQPTTWRALRESTGLLLGADGSWLTIPALLLVGLGLWKAQRAIVTMWLMTPMALAYFASLIKPMFVPRYFLISLPAACIVAAAGACELGRRARNAAIATLMCLSIVGVASLAGAPPREDWKSVIGEVTTDGFPVVLGWSTAVAPFDYYIQQHGIRLSRTVINGEYDGGRDALETRVQSLQRFWLVGTSSRAFSDQNRRSQSIIEANHTAMRRHSYIGLDAVISVTLYERDPQSSVETKARD